MILFRALSSSRDQLPSDLPTEKVVLDVGGHLFHTSMKTLCKRESLLADIMRLKTPIKPDKEGVWFIDRDPHLFTRILSYLRNDRLLLGANVDDLSLTELKLEAEFFKLTELEEGIAKVLKDRQQQINEMNRPRSLYRVHYHKPERQVVGIEPYPEENGTLDVTRLSKAFANGLEATVNEMLAAGFRIETAHWDTQDRFKSFVIMSGFSM